MSQMPPGGGNPFAEKPNPNPYDSPQGFQPAGGGQPLAPGSVKTYLGEAIFCLICCGGIFAIPAIVYAAQVNGKLQSGDYRGAVEASENAKKWCIVAVCIGVICNTAAGIFQVLAISAGVNT